MQTAQGTLRVSAGQFSPGEDKEENLRVITRLVEEAAAANVRVLVLPELAMYRRINAPLEHVASNAESLQGTFVSSILELSRQHSIMIAVGMYETLSNSEMSSTHAQNTLVIADQGHLLHAYRKLHLYDAFSAKESDSIVAGEDLPPIIEIDGFRIGFAICYDIRFPELFRILAEKGVDAFAIATAWARGVGKEDHWDVLTRCRAIENTAYVIASDEVSINSVGRSRIIDPLGYSLGDAGEQDEKLVVADIDHERLRSVRATLPALENRRLRISDQLVYAHNS